MWNYYNSLAQPQAQQYQMYQPLAQQCTSTSSTSVDNIMEKVTSLLPNLIANSLKSILPQPQQKAEEEDSGPPAPKKIRMEVVEEEEEKEDNEDKENDSPPSGVYRDRLRWIRDLLGLDTSEHTEVEVIH